MQLYFYPSGKKTFAHSKGGHAYVIATSADWEFRSGKTEPKFKTAYRLYLAPTINTKLTSIWYKMMTQK